MENSQFVDPAARLADIQAEIMQNTLVKINSHCSEIMRVTKVGLSNLIAPNAEFLMQMHQEQVSTRPCFIRLLLRLVVSNGSSTVVANIRDADECSVEIQ